MPNRLIPNAFGSVLVVLAQVTGAGAQSTNMKLPLDTLIRQNAASAALTYRSLSNPAMSAELRIYARTTGEKTLVDGKLGWVKSIGLKEQSLTIDPVQVLTLGPPSSELRYFASQDKAAATELYADLSRGIPGLQLRDASSLYSQAATIGRRRYELWLAPNLTHFGP